MRGRAAQVVNRLTGALRLSRRTIDRDSGVLTRASVAAGASGGFR